MASVSGTKTFLFTDIEGSTRLWDRYPDQMRAALARHDLWIREAIESNGGRVFKTVGDAFCAAFPAASHAVAAAIHAQQNLATAEASSTDFPGLRVRMAIHTGVAENRDGDYFGGTLNRVERLLEICHGGQTLVTGASAVLMADNMPAATNLRDLGVHRLKDLQQPEQVFQIEHPDLPREFEPLRSLENTPNNLPRQLTSFIGREKELGEITELVRRDALVTLTGTGGCGKTRLALQTAAQMLEEFPDGVWLVELASLTDSTLVINPVAVAVGTRTSQSVLTPEVVEEHIGTGKMLIVLDNCEHLVQACAELVESILQGCHNLHVLATSRQALGLSGETSYRVPSLSAPEPNRNISLKKLAQIESVRLFTERARAVSNTFELNERNAQSVAKICRRLDGIPLALELAASRINVLSPYQIDERLHDRFKILTGGSRTSLMRHQTLRATIDWSYDLLTEFERNLLTRLSVFSGGWTLRAAETICCGGPLEESDILDVLGALVDKSLVTMEDGHGGEGRYRLLETIRQYAEEKFAASGLAEKIRGRHRDFYLEMAEEAAPHIQQADQQLWLDRLESDHDNVRAALGWSVEAEVRLRLAVAMHRFWLVRGYHVEGRSRLSGSLVRATKAPERVKANALNAAGILSWAAGDYEVARTEFEESLNYSRIVGDDLQFAKQANNLGIIAYELGDYESAKRYYEESLPAFRAQGDAARVATVLCNIGVVTRAAGDLSRAREYLCESASLFDQIGDTTGSARAFLNLGQIGIREDDIRQSLTHLKSALRSFSRVREMVGWVVTLQSLGVLAARVGCFETAARLLGATSNVAKTYGASLPEHDAEDLRLALDLLEKNLPVEEHERLFQSGIAMSLVEATDLALTCEYA